MNGSKTLNTPQDEDNILEHPKASDGLCLGIDRKWWILAVVGSGTFMSALDTSIVNIALPVIGKVTRSPVSTVEWVILIYLITVSASLLVFGRLADIYGMRRIYILGQIIFTLGSLICGISGRVELLIPSRAIQAIGAAMLFALSPAVLISAFPSRERGRALGLQATMTYLGSSTGPVLGGLLTQHLGWPYIFYVNVPIGIAMALVSSKVLRQERRDTVQPFDPAGAGLMAVALASLLFALSKGMDIGWNSTLIRSMFGIAAVAGLMFVIVERRIAHPAIDFKLFANRTFSASTVAAFLCHMSTGAINFLMPFFLIHANGYPESKAGLILIATPIAMMLLTGPSGYISDKIGVRWPATIGMVVYTAGVLLLRRLYPGIPPHAIIPSIALIGVGAGLFTSPNNSAIMGSAPQESRGVAGAILAAARTTGFASGVAVAGLIYVTRLHALSALPEPIAISRAVQTGMAIIACVTILGALLSAIRGKTGARMGAD